MICQDCRHEGRKSKVYIKHSIPRIVRAEFFYDEDGNYHIHDESGLYVHYLCSNGHKLMRIFPSVTCPSCDFGKVDE